MRRSTARARLLGRAHRWPLPRRRSVLSTAVAATEAGREPVAIRILPLSFISGVYIPSLRLPSALQHVAQAFPLQHLVAALDRGFLPGSTGVAWGDLAIVAVWGLAGFALALRRFRWAPSTAAPAA